MAVIEISDDRAAVLSANARARGLSLEEWLAKLASEESASATQNAPEPTETALSGGRHISEVIRERMRNVPAEVWAQLPTDGASEHDHYVYGLPKKGS